MSLLRSTLLVLLMVSCSALSWGQQERQPPESPTTYDELRDAFTNPDHARWGEVPLWWWEGDRMDRDRVRWELETLAAQGVKSVCPIQRSPARCDPASFTPAWWEMFTFVHQECQRLGMSLWAYDQIGYGHYGWLEKAAAKTEDPLTGRVLFLTADATPSKPARLELPKGKLLGARAYRIVDGVAEDARSQDVSPDIRDRVFTWKPASGTWRVAVSIVIPEPTFQLSAASAETFLDMLYGEVERRLGRRAMGTSFAGVFQDEHPPTPRDVMTPALAKLFRDRFGYPIDRAIPALHFDIGPRTPKYRSDFFDAYLAEDERCYWKRVYDWTAERGLLTSHDNWGRNNVVAQSQGYIDYFRTQRWFSAPGYDDAGQAPIVNRNYYDTKIASSIARLYQRPRVWSEAFHSSGWGRTTDQTLTWLSANYVFGANLYDEHGLYYSARASTWEHAAPDPHWRQPYWRYYHVLSDWVARTSYIMSQGSHVVDAAVHYPVVSLLAGDAPGQKSPDYNHYMRLSRSLFDAAIDNDIIDDDSIMAGTVRDGRLVVAGNGYQALVFDRERTMRRAVLRKLIELVDSGGCVVFFGAVPTASTDAGRDDPELQAMLETLFGVPASELRGPLVTRRPGSRGCAAFLPDDIDALAPLVAKSIERDVTPRTDELLFVTHRRIGSTDIYLLQNPAAEKLVLDAEFRADGVPELWDAFTGQVHPVEWFQRNDSITRVRQSLSGNMARLLVFRSGSQRQSKAGTKHVQPSDLERTLPKDWAFSVIPTRDNRRGEYRWPPSKEMIGPEIRSFRYAEETAHTGLQSEWQQPGFDDRTWRQERYSIGPYWLYVTGIRNDVDAASVAKADASGFAPGTKVAIADKTYAWKTVEFSKTIGLAKPAPWGGHSGYPDGAIDQNFIELPPGHKLLFTRIRSPRQQRLGLRIELRNSAVRVWVNGQQQPVEGAVANLPLRAGANQVLIDLPDGGHGRLFVQATPPSVDSMAAAGSGAGAPPFDKAMWIQASDSGAGYVRKVFTLPEEPLEAKVVVTGYTGYRLFVNGKQVEEDIGPWAKWTHPESLDITSYLQAGKNVVAAWIQVHSGQHVAGKPADQALAFALKAKLPSGKSFSLVSDASWKRAIRLFDGWQAVAFDDTAWSAVAVRGTMGAKPYGNEPLANVGAVTEPRRKLAIDLPAPYLTCFDEVADIVYDVHPTGKRIAGWYRFNAPPGLKKLQLHTTAAAQVWVDGQVAEVDNGEATIARPPRAVSLVAIRIQEPAGSHAGAALPKPIGMELSGGVIQPGLWADFALPTYSGIGVYKQTLTLTAAETQRHSVLDLGNVLVAAELLVNGKSAGVRLARPFAFDITQLVHAGANKLEVRVANTLAPHYTETNHSQNLGPTESGLLGPVVLRQRLEDREWVSWAEAEEQRLLRQLATTNSQLKAAQRTWESTASWTVPKLLEGTSTDGRSLQQAADGWVCASEDRGSANGTGSIRCAFVLAGNRMGVTGIRLESKSQFLLASENSLASKNSEPSGDRFVDGVSLLVERSDAKPFRGRFVRLQVVGRTSYLHVAEVQVMSNGKNVAPLGKARQSSVTGDASADRAIDGNTDGQWSGNSVCHTHNEHEPWWELDLGHNCDVNQIVVWNRTDGELEDRLVPLQVTLLDAQRNVVWQELVTEKPDPVAMVHLSPISVQLELVGPHGADRWIAVTPSDGRLPADAVSAPGAHGNGHGVALFATRPPFGFPEGTRLMLDLHTISTGQQNGSMDRFRIATTTMKSPLCDIPAEIATILQVAEELRSKEQAEQLAVFYRSIAPALAPVRERLAQLRSERADQP